MKEYKPIENVSVVLGYDISGGEGFGGKKIVIYLKDESTLDFTEEKEIEGEFKLKKLIQCAKDNSGLDEYMIELGLLTENK